MTKATLMLLLVASLFTSRPAYALTCVLTADEPTDETLDSFCGQYGYKAELTDPNDSEKKSPNPETKEAFARRVVCSFISESAIAYDRNKAVALESARVLDAAQKKHVIK